MTIMKENPLLCFPFWTAFEFSVCPFVFVFVFVCVFVFAICQRKTFAMPLLLDRIEGCPNTTDTRSTMKVFMIARGCLHDHHKHRQHPVFKFLIRI